MIIKIGDNRKLVDIQEEFSAAFPNLKINFFSLPHLEYQSEEKRLELGGQSLIKNIRACRNKGFIAINPAMTAFEIEETFSVAFGLNAQIFYKAGDRWQETTDADEENLYALNSRGVDNSSQNEL